MKEPTVIPLNTRMLPPKELLKELQNQKEIVDIIIIAFEDNGISYMTHTGASPNQLALASLYCSREFDHMLDDT